MIGCGATTTGPSSVVTGPLSRGTPLRPRHRAFPCPSVENIFLIYFFQFFNGPFALLGLPKQQLPRYEDVDVGHPDLARNNALELRL